MLSPFRLAPPKCADRRLIERPRLLDILDGRFERRLTILRAGAGFGKTTLLMQALERSGDDPMRVDHWLGCGPQDEREGDLAAGLRGAVGVAGTPADTVRAVCNAVWKQSPAEVAIVLDDVHHISPDGPSAQLLARLLEELPANGHLVLASRKEPPVPAARLLATAQAEIIEESQLAFDGAERSSFLALRGAQGGERGSSGWPAVLELAATTGTERVGDYLWEEVLAGLPKQRLRGLARMSCLDWIDADRIEAFTGRAEDVGALVADVPLTSFEPSGAARLHGLWAQVLATIDPEWTRAELRAAWEFLAGGGHYAEAIELCLHNDREDEILDVLGRLIRRIWFDGDPVTVEGLLAMMPARMHSSPAGQLLQGWLRLRTDPNSADPYLRAAQQGFAAAGDVDAEVVALAALGLVCFFRVELSELEPLGRRASELATDAGLAYHHIFRATRLYLQGRPEVAQQHIDEARRLPVDLVGIDAGTLAGIFLDLGEPQRAIAEIDSALSKPCSDIAVADLLASRFEARWMSGELAANELAAFDDGLPVGAVAHVHNAAVFLSILSFQNASAGRAGIARAHLESAAVLLQRGLGPRAGTAFAVAKMAVEILGGDEQAARATIEECLSRLDDDILVHRHTLRGMALASAVSAAAKERLAFLRPGPVYRPSLDAAAALIAHRRDGDSGPALALPWEDHRPFAVFLVPSVVLELAVIASEAGNEHAGRLAEQLAVDHRDVLRALASNGSGLARAASDLLGRVPERPPGRLEVRVLGNLDLLRDGVPIDDPALRRERVRALFHYLIAEGSSQRDELAAVLWPGLDERERANNLRVSMSYARGLLEPDRDSGAPSFFLRQTGDRILLRTDDGLAVDAHLFDEQVVRAEAADAAGDPAQALQRFESALALYRGDYLCDAADQGWGSADRTRLRSSFVRSALRAAELRLGRGDEDEALAWAVRVQAIDPLAEAAYRMQALVYRRRGDRSAARAALEAGLVALEHASVTPEPDSLRLASRLGLDVSRWAASPVAANGAPSEAANGAASGDASVSSRELDVLRLVDAGLSNAEIARRLFVAPSTVKKHLENVYDKLGVRRRTQAVQRVRERGLLD